MTANVKKSPESSTTVSSISESSDPVVFPDYDANIAELAYFKAESRNFEPGHELDDWLEAEREYTQV